MNETNEPRMQDMKLKIERLLKPLTEKTGTRPDGTPWKFSFTDVDGTLDGKPAAGVTVKAWNGDAKRIAVGAELDVKPDEKARDGEEAYVVLPERKTGGKGGFGGGPRGGLTPMQFLLDQRVKMATAALEGAVELTKALGDKEKALPLANKMF